MDKEIAKLLDSNFLTYVLEGKNIDEKFDAWENNLLMIRYDDEILVHGYKGWW